MNPRNPNPAQILILNPSSGGVTLFSLPLKLMRLVRGTHFDGAQSPDEIERRIFEKAGPQLLIISSFGTEIEPAVAVAKKLREKNPELVVVFADTIACEGDDFDRVVHIDVRQKNQLDPIGQAARDFLAGTLRRQTATAMAVS